MSSIYAVFCGDESRLRAVFDELAAHGPILIVVDQPNTIGALPVTVARAYGHDVAYLPVNRHGLGTASS